MEQRVLAGRYQLIAKLGEGGMGSVWRAQHLALGTPLAIKLIDPGMTQSAEAVARFKREAQSTASLRSVHVVQVIDYGIDEGIPFIAMELLEGETLAARLERVYRLSPTSTAGIVTQVARALTRAHAAGIVHRDLKPANIFLVPEVDDDITKVLDFGIAKKLERLTESAGVKTRAGVILGSPYYMSPEQALGQTTIDHRTDIWSLGVIACQCLTGQRPFDRDTPGALLMAICSEPVPKPSALTVVPAGFDAWFARATARNPAERFESAAEAAAQLREICGATACNQLSLASLRSDTTVSGHGEPLSAVTSLTPSALSHNAVSSNPIFGRSGRHVRNTLAAVATVILLTTVGLVVSRGTGQRTPIPMPSIQAIVEPTSERSPSTELALPASSSSATVPPPKATRIPSSSRAPSVARRAKSPSVAAPPLVMPSSRPPVASGAASERDVSLEQEVGF